jgi:hypothetical protein
MSSSLKRSIFAEKNPQEYHTFMILLINYPKPYLSNMSHSPDVYETEKPPLCDRISSSLWRTKQKKNTPIEESLKVDIYSKSD